MTGYDSNEINQKSNGGTELSIRSIQDSLPKNLLENFQIIPSRVRDIKEDKIRVYHLHDLAEDPEASHLKDQSSRDRFHKLIFVSNWQLQDYVNKLKIPQDRKLQVIENPIVPIPPHKKVFKDDKVNLIYFSTPQRGLELLVPVVDELSKKYPNIHLDVYSSFEIYGWKNMDEKYQPLYDRISNHPNMTYFGYADQEELRSALQCSHILAYPCIWQETSCRVLIESMSAGLLCVHPNLAALPETSGGLTMQYQYIDDHKLHAAVFYKNLELAIQMVKEDYIQKYMKFVKVFADSKYNLDKISNTWKSELNQLLVDYPEVKDRGIVKTSTFFNYSR